MGAILAVLMALSVVVAGVNGRIPELTRAALEAAGTAAAFAIGLVGALALWSGLMRVAEEAGAVRFVAWLARPALRRLFPGVPADHPALGSVVMNFAANFLGLGNAATPMGIKAMQELETLNPRPGTATDAQVMLVALNTASVQLVPVTMITLRLQAGSRAPEEIILPTLLASACGVVVAVAAARLLRRLAPVPDGA
ncbi:MAG TPA: nucleoside recognition domain-containing protein [Anaeromyxobacter sp.]|nr:nucleoside recognition domain-containing protein [Anaeromyxobacter sp.]